MRKWTKFQRAPGYLTSQRKKHTLAGKHVTKDQSIYWGSRTETGELVSSGIYFYTIQTDQYTKTRKMMILKQLGLKDLKDLSILFIVPIWRTISRTPYSNIL